MWERSDGCLPVLLLLLVSRLRLGRAEFRFPSGEGEKEGVTASQEQEQEAARRSYSEPQLPGEVQTETKITVGNTKHLRGNRFHLNKCMHGWFPPPSLSLCQTWKVKLLNLLWQIFQVPPKHKGSCSWLNGPGVFVAPRSPLASVNTLKSK